MNKKIWLFPLLVVGLFASCSESDDVQDEYRDWKGRNEAFFNEIYQHADSAIQAGSRDWKIIRNWSLLEQFGSKKDNNIVVHVLDSNKQTQQPIYTDSVVVDIQGRLMPANSEDKGYVFYSSFAGKDRKLKTDLFVTLSADGKLQQNEIDGLSTAIQQMHVGDRWLVYVPYNLALKGLTVSTLVVPAYSTMIFDLTLMRIK